MFALIRNTHSSDNSGSFYSQSQNMNERGAEVEGQRWERGKGNEEEKEYSVDISFSWFFS